MSSSSDRRWNIAGAVTAVIAVIGLAVAIGVGFTRTDESSAVAPVAPLSVPVPKKIAVIGDSYTAGTEQGGIGADSWAELSFRQLRTEGVEVVSDVAANGGSGYLARGPSGLNLNDEVSQVATPEDDVVVIFGGLNDVTLPLPDVSQAVADAFATLRERAPTAKIVVVGPAWPNDRLPPQILELRDSIRDQANQMGATFVDPIADQWFVADPALIGADEIHPTKEGHVYMSERLLPYLRSALLPQAEVGG